MTDGGRGGMRFRRLLGISPREYHSGHRRGGEGKKQHQRGRFQTKAGSGNKKGRIPQPGSKRVEENTKPKEKV